MNLLNIEQSWTKVIICWIICWAISVIHEIGHCAAFKLNGVDVRKVKLGIGPSIEFGKFSIGLIPGGVTLPGNMDVITTENENKAFLGISMAGLLTQLLVLAPMLWLMPQTQGTQLLQLCNWILIISNLIPFKLFKSVSDGYIGFKCLINIMTHNISSESL